MKFVQATTKDCIEPCMFWHPSIHLLLTPLLLCFPSSSFAQLALSSAWQGHPMKFRSGSSEEFHSVMHDLAYFHREVVEIPFVLDSLSSFSSSSSSSLSSPRSLVPLSPLASSSPFALSCLLSQLFHPFLHHHISESTVELVVLLQTPKPKPAVWQRKSSVLAFLTSAS